MADIQIMGRIIRYHYVVVLLLHMVQQYPVGCVGTTAIQGRSFGV